MRSMLSKASLTIAALAILPAAALAATYYPRMFDTKRGGSVCYSRVYTDAFLKKNPAVKLKTISMERRNSVSDSVPNSAKKFRINFGATTKSEDYSADAYCRHQGNAISCDVESDGGKFTIYRAGKGVIIKTRRIEIEGVFQNLNIASVKGGTTRSFTLRGNGKETCASVFD